MQTTLDSSIQKQLLRGHKSTENEIVPMAFAMLLSPNEQITKLIWLAKARICHKYINYLDDRVSCY